MSVPLKTKLVRDRAPRQYLNTTRVILKDQPAYHQLALRAKITEELQEVALAPWDLDEWADLVQAMLDYMHVCGIDEGVVEVHRHIKQERLGGFLDGLLATTDDPDYKSKPIK